MSKFVLKLCYLNSHRDLGTINTTSAGYSLERISNVFCFAFSSLRLGITRTPQLHPFSVCKGIRARRRVIRKYWLTAKQCNRERLWVLEVISSRIASLLLAIWLWPCQLFSLGFSFLCKMRASRGFGNYYGHYLCSSLCLTAIIV